ncbi:MAG: glycosyltransferase [Spirochaetes bacterium]|nr:glycosyltransferase [Spirochaetota bacterium]
MKKLNIAYFLDNFYPQVNGVVTSSINTCSEMSKRGHRVLAVAPKPFDLKNYPEDYFPYDIVFQDGFPAYFYPDFNFTYTFDNKIYKKLKEFKPDLIHFHAPFTLGYQAIRIAKKLKVPVVGTFHTFFAEPEYLKLIGMENNKFLQNFGWFYSNNFFNKCDMAVSPGKATAEILKKNKLKTPIQIISNGVECMKYQNFNCSYKLTFSYKEEFDYILYIGRVSQEKDIDILLDSLTILLKKKKNTILVVVGGGPSIEDLKKRSVELGIKDNVIFTGMIPNKDLLESGLLKKVKLFVTASTSENQPMTILESIMFGLPIVGVDARGVPELVEGNGFIVKPKDPEALAEKMYEILSNEKLRETFSKRSLELSEKYDIRNTSDVMEKMYMSLLD